MGQVFAVADLTQLVSPASACHPANHAMQRQSRVLAGSSSQDLRLHVCPLPLRPSCCGMLSYSLPLLHLSKKWP